MKCERISILLLIRQRPLLMSMWYILFTSFSCLFLWSLFSEIPSVEDEDELRVNHEAIITEVEDSLKEYFAAEELSMITESIQWYHNGDTVDNLLNTILPLFTPRKFSLLRTVRNVIFADEMLQYDRLINAYLESRKREPEAWTTLQRRTVYSNNTSSDKPRR